MFYETLADILSFGGKSVHKMALPMLTVYADISIVIWICAVVQFPGWHYVMCASAWRFCGFSLKHFKRKLFGEGSRCLLHSNPRNRIDLRVSTSSIRHPFLERKRNHSIPFPFPILSSGSGVQSQRKRNQSLTERQGNFRWTRVRVYEKRFVHAWEVACSKG